MQHESWYFSFVPTSSSRRTRQQGTDVLSPSSIESRIGSPSPFSPLSPLSGHAFSPTSPYQGPSTPPSGRASKHTSGPTSPNSSSLHLPESVPDTSSSPKFRRIALSTPSHFRRNKEKYKGTEEDQSPPISESARPQSGRTVSISSIEEDANSSLERQSQDNLRRHPNRDSVSSVESVASEGSGQEVTTSRSRKPSGLVAKEPGPDYFASSLVASDFKGDDDVDEFTGVSKKALKRLGLGGEDIITPRPVASSGGHSRVSPNANNLVYPRRGSQASSSTSSSENASPEESPKGEDSRRPSLWKALSPSYIKASRTREKAKGMKIEIANPSLSFVSTEAPLATARPIANDSPARMSYSNASQTSLSPSTSPRLSMPTGVADEGIEKDYNQNVFRAKVATGSEEDADKYLEVPEHLPTSPLCPRHPKHRSKGAGYCPYHGRN